MQKIFIRYFVIIMVITVGLTLLGNFTLQTFFSQKKAENEAARMFVEISRKIENNEQIIQKLVVHANEDYIARAKALAEMITQNPSMIENFDEMKRIAKVLNVDEVHVTDEKGILRWGNMRDYYGLDFSTTDQTKPFMPGLTDKNFVLAQEAWPNGGEGRRFQYIGVARQDKPGIVQVGVVPEVLDNALSHTKIDKVIDNFNVNNGLNVVAFDRDSGVVVGDTNNAFLGKTYQELSIDDSYFYQRKRSGWIKTGGEELFAVFGQMDDYFMEITFTKEQLFVERNNQNFVAAVSSILLGLAIMVTIFKLLKRMIIKDMETVNRDLKNITNGSLDVIVNVKSTPEVVVLSAGINEMVNSLHTQMDEIAQQAAVLEEKNKNILSSLKYAKKIQNNLLPTAKPFEETFSDYSILWEPRDIVGGDIYWMKKFEEGSVLCVCDCTGHGTPGALLTMLVVSTLNTVVDKYNSSDTAKILWELEQRLISILNVSGEERDSVNIKDGADLSILFIKNDGEITLSSAKLHLFVCNGSKVENIRGQKITIGDGSLKCKDQIKTLTIPACKENAYYIVSDGLFEQVGGENHIPFGYTRFKQMIMENHGQSQGEITEIIWREFESYMGVEQRRDDVTLVSFKL